DLRAGEGGSVEGGDEFERLPGVDGGDRRRPAVAQRGEGGGELRGVAGAGPRRDRLPQGGDLLARVGGGREPPRVVAVAVQVFQLHGRAGEVEAQVAGLPGGQQTVDDDRGGAAGQGDDRGGEVLRRGRAGLARGRGAYGLPRADQGQQQVHLVDAVPHRRPAALRLPRAPPRDGEVFVGAEPQRVAQRQVERAEGVPGEHFPQGDGAGAE